jgi:YbgC/YbaW family acyl-CoA thioester hydrolase
MLPLSEVVYRRRVQFPETDASGIVHFTNFFKYVEEAEHAMWRAAGLTVDDRTRGITWPRVAASFEFKKPLRFEDEFDVRLRIVEIKSKSIRYAAVLEKDGEPLANGSLTIVCAARIPGRPLKATDIPADILSRIAVAPLLAGT